MSRERETAPFRILFENFTKTPASECCCDPRMTHVNEQLAAETLRSSSTKRPDGPWENQFPCIWSAHVCVFLLQGCIYTMCFLSLSPALIGNALTSDSETSLTSDSETLCLSVCVWLKVKCASFPHKWVCMGPLQDGLHSHTLTVHRFFSCSGIYTLHISPRVVQQSPTATHGSISARVETVSVSSSLSAVLDSLQWSHIATAAGDPGKPCLSKEDRDRLNM